MLSTENIDAVIALAGLPDMVRGYEHIKLANVDRYRSALSAALASLTSSGHD